MNKKTTLKQFIFSDYDKDQVKNIDDPYPFNPNKSKWPTPTPKGDFYRKARYGDPDSHLSDALKEIETRNNQHRQFLGLFLKQNPQAYGRIKSVPSTIKKMTKNSYQDIGDVAGATIPVEKRPQVFETATQMMIQYKHDPKRTDDYYTNPISEGAYMAYHLGLLKNNQRMELQIKTKKMEALQKEMHPYYKRKTVPQRFISRAKKLFEQGY